MNYQQSIKYLYGLQKYGIKFGLTNITTLLASLNNPHKRLPCVHIAGTNGKGSTAAFLASILSRAGYKVGLYTSPHLVHFTERIKINNLEIQKQEVARLTALLKERVEKITKIDSITFFEITTAMALLHFCEHNVDLGILEVGMGGRLDATNVITPLVSIITNISMEHEFYLGNTLLKIAHEKAGIIKKKGVVVTGVTQSKIQAFLKQQCSQLQSLYYQLGKDFILKKNHSSLLHYYGINKNLEGIVLGLQGEHQQCNAALALATCEILERRGYRIGDEALRQGLEIVTWPGRLEIMQHSPVVVLDGAHNPAAIRKLKKALLHLFTFRKLTLVMGIMGDKNIKGMFREIIPLADRVILCKPSMERAASTQNLARLVEDYNISHLEIDNVEDATRFAIATAHPEDVICVTGSLFTVGEARQIFTSSTD